MILIFYPLKTYAKDNFPVGQAAITIDLDTNEIIYKKNIDVKMYPASITKLITAIILAEKKSPNDILIYSDKAKSEEPSKLDLEVGEKVSAKDAMNALLMYSANDIAYMIAENISGTAEDFSILMNTKAQELGLKSTHFVTPNGLPDPNHYSTAYDLAILSKAVYKNPWIMETLGTKTIQLTTSSKTIDITNTNKFLGTDGCIGGKTGYTQAAGRCLMCIYERNGTKMLGIVLKSEYDENDTVVFDDMKKIIDYSYDEKDSLHNVINPMRNDILVFQTTLYLPYYQ